MPNSSSNSNKNMFSSRRGGGRRYDNNNSNNSNNEPNTANVDALADERENKRLIEINAERLAQMTNTSTNGKPIREIEISKIKPNPYQARKTFLHLDELAEAIKVQGFRSVLMVRPEPGTRGECYQLVYGERRLRAAQMAGLTRVPCQVEDNLTETQMIEIGLIENLQRDDLEPLEEADAYNQLYTLRNYTIEDIVKRTGKNINHVRTRLALKQAKPEEQEVVAINPQKASAVAALTALKKPEEQNRRQNLLEEIKAGNTTTEEIRQKVRAIIHANEQQIQQQKPVAVVVNTDYRRGDSTTIIAPAIPVTELEPIRPLQQQQQVQQVQMPNENSNSNIYTYASTTATGNSSNLDILDTVQLLKETTTEIPYTPRPDYNGGSRQIQSILEAWLKRMDTHPNERKSIEVYLVTIKNLLNRFDEFLN